MKYCTTLSHGSTHVGPTGLACTEAEVCFGWARSECMYMTIWARTHEWHTFKSGCSRRRYVPNLTTARRSNDFGHLLVVRSTPAATTTSSYVYMIALDLFVHFADCLSSDSDAGTLIGRPHSSSFSRGAHRRINADPVCVSVDCGPPASSSCLPSSLVIMLRSASFKHVLSSGPPPEQRQGRVT